MYGFKNKRTAEQLKRIAMQPIKHNDKSVVPELSADGPRIYLANPITVIPPAEMQEDIFADSDGNITKRFCAGKGQAVVYMRDTHSDYAEPLTGWYERDGNMTVKPRHYADAAYPDRVLNDALTIDVYNATPNEYAANVGENQYDIKTVHNMILVVEDSFGTFWVIGQQGQNQIYETIPISDDPSGVCCCGNRVAINEQSQCVETSDSHYQSSDNIYNPLQFPREDLVSFHQYKILSEPITVAIDCLDSLPLNARLLVRIAAKCSGCAYLTARFNRAIAFILMTPKPV